MLLPIRIWKDIKKYEGLYQVSNLGEIRSKHTGEWLKIKCSKSAKCYKKVVLCNNGKKEVKLVHRLVAEAFISNPNNLSQVNHKDENPSNNMAINLEWCNQKYNMNYGTVNERIGKSSRGRKRTQKSIKSQIERQCKKVYCIEIDKIFNSLKEASEYVGVHNSCITRAAKGKQNTAVGYHWKYINNKEG